MKKRTVDEMMDKCRKCDLFQFCFREEVSYGVKMSERNREVMVKSLSEMTQKIGMNKVARREFVMNAVFFFEWIFNSKKTGWMCHHEVPHEVPPGPIKGETIWSPEVSASLSRLQRDGLVERRTVRRKEK